MCTSINTKSTKPTNLFASSVVVQTLVDVQTVAAVGVQHEAGSAAAHVAAGSVVAEVVAAARPLLTLVGVFARFSVHLQHVTFATRTDGAVGPVLTALVATCRSGKGDGGMGVENLVP